MIVYFAFARAIELSGVRVAFRIDDFIGQPCVWSPLAKLIH
ncbi:hypothetical protein C4K25_4040 [Pseudomonas chlororaphis]|nr:hypothetical protein C4K25_4040 [Pseudomonas chlororaphis]